MAVLLIFLDKHQMDYTQKSPGANCSQGFLNIFGLYPGIIYSDKSSSW